jgi:PAS domain S-box-containing protein
MISEIFHKEPLFPGQEDGTFPWEKIIDVFFNAIPDAVGGADARSRVVISNAVCQRSLGVFPGTLVDAIFPQLSDRVSTVIQTMEPLVDVAVALEKRRFSVDIHPIVHDHGVAGVLWIFHDTTEMDRLKKSLKYFQHLSYELDTLIDSSNDGLWICDGSGVVLRLNAASERLNELKAGDMIGKRMEQIVAEGYVNKSVTLDVLRTGKRTSIFQRIRNGKKLFLTGSPVFDKETGKIFRVVVNERDITEITNLQAELRQTEALNNQYKRDLLAMQIEETESRQIIARSANYVATIQKAVKLAHVDSTVVFLGESGTGKSILANLIHKHSARSDEPLIKLNCGAIPEALVESELFGYEKGAFTGAHKSGKPGKFEMADKGTLFLDEIGELPLMSQVKLLGFLEDGTVCRVGGTVNRTIDVRIIAATNQDLKAMIEKNLFRRDLYYRLNVIPLAIPPLRERRDCILPLLNHYVDLFSKKYAKTRAVSLTPEVADALLLYAYPGNVRELINICERLVVMSSRGCMAYTDLPASVVSSLEPGTCDPELWDRTLTLQEMIERLEKKVLEKTMEAQGTQKKTAELLGLNQSTVARKLKKYAIGT